MDQKCRFCFKIFNENEKYYGITESIKENFELLAQIKFILSTTQKNLICELCMRSLQIAALLKNQFIENQTKFLALDQIKAEVSMKIEDVTISDNLINPEAIDEKYENISVEKTNILKNDPVTKKAVVVQDPVSQAIKVDPPLQNQIPVKIEKIEQNGDKQQILGTSNLKTIKKSSRQKKLSAKAREVIKQQQEADSSFRCPFCLKIFGFAIHLNSHIWSDHNSEILRCNICSKLFLNQQNLDNHIKQLHPKNRNYVCTLCPKTYTSNNCLKKHMYTKHPNSKYRCKYNSCMMTFDRYDGMRTHVGTAHPEMKFRDIISFIDRVES